MSTARGILPKACLALVGAVSAFVMAEGGWSLATGGSLVSFLLDRRMGSIGTMQDRAPRDGDGKGNPTRDAAGAAEGEWAHSPDPGVAMTMKRNRAREIVGAVATMDRWGQRVRPGPPPEDGALRIVVLGDSVAFGFGVADDQTFGHELEQHLARVVPPGSPRPVVLTVACPGWNTQNEVRFLLNELGRLDPDIVVLMPVENDLDDQFMVGDGGVRGAAYDPTLGTVRPHVCGEHWVRLYNQTKDNTSRAETLLRAARGNLANSVAYVAETDITPWSIARWDEVVGLVEELEARLRANDCKLMVAFRSQNSFETMFDERVRTRLPDVPVLTYFETFGDGDHLDGDSHPNARYTKAGAWCIAEALLEHGWIPGGRREALGGLDPTYRDRRAPERSLADLRAAIAAMKVAWREFLGPRIDLRAGEGFHQVYGGVAGERVVGRHVLFALANDGGTKLELELERSPADTGLYPLRLTPRFNGVAGEPRDVPPPAGDDAAYVLTFELPLPVRDDALLDIQIDSSNWTMSVVDRRLTLTAYRFTSARLTR